MKTMIITGSNGPILLLYIKPFPKDLPKGHEPFLAQAVEAWMEC